MTSNVSALRGASKDPDPGEGVAVDPGAKPVRRTFTAEYRARIVAEYEAAPRGSKAAVLRREGLYQSQVREWTQARDAAAGMGEAPRPHRASKDSGGGRETARLRAARGPAAEALLRWHHPDGQLRTAAAFIEIAEQTGLIRQIGDWVLHQACAQAAQWSADGNPLVVRINQSALQLGEPGMLASLHSAIVAAGVDPRHLCVEITETVMLHDNPTVAANLAGISRRGVDIAIDDFGTGYASLTYCCRTRGMTMLAS